MAKKKVKTSGGDPQPRSAENVEGIVRALLDSLAAGNRVGAHREAYSLTCVIGHGCELPYVSVENVTDITVAPAVERTVYQVGKETRPVMKNVVMRKEG